MDKELKTALHNLRIAVYNIEIYCNKMIDLAQKSISATDEATRAIQKYLEAANDKNNKGHERKRN